MHVPALNPGDGRTSLLHQHLRVGPFLITCKSYRSAFERSWHLHAAAAVDFVIAGTGETRFRRGDLIAGPGDLWYCPADYRQAHRAGAAGMRCMHIAFLPGELHGAPSPRVAPGKLRSPGAAGLALSILRALASPDASTPLEVESLAQELVACAAGGDSVPARSRALETARALLHETLHAPIGLRALADHCGISPGRLAVGFRATFGVTAGHYHRQVRISEAIRRLARSDEPVARIAIATGFVDQAHLTNTMRTECGETPARLRRLLRDRAANWAALTGSLAAPPG